jgi:hypothetical protein
MKEEENRRNQKERERGKERKARRPAVDGK